MISIVMVCHLNLYFEFHFSIHITRRLNRSLTGSIPQVSSIFFPLAFYWILQNIFPQPQDICICYFLSTHTHLVRVYGSFGSKEMFSLTTPHPLATSDSLYNSPGFFFRALNQLELYI